MADFSIQHEKLAQAVDILNEQGVDLWMTFVRETTHNNDPALPLIVNINMTWQSAFLVSRSGQKIAIVGRYDVENIKRMGGFDEVIGYDASIRPALLEVLERLNPRQIALNYSISDSAADGLSHGMYLTLVNYLQDRPYTLISAEDILNSLRGRKSASEIGRIRKAVATTVEIIDGVSAMLKPGLSEVDIANYIHGEMDKRGLEPSWERAYCPIVNCGPESPVGHTGPSEKYVAQPGHIVHIDLGVVVDDYVSDMQRVWYLQPEGETQIPEAIQRGFKAVRKAIEDAAAVLKPGVQGWEVDKAARDSIVDSGYPEYQHAVGHHIGRTVHDGATLLGPKWERYGKSPEGIVEAGNVFTLELGVEIPGHGAISLEEDVLVKEDGLEWLAPPQTEVVVIKV
jgi:Xaa-Pro aminopeptidase